MVDYLSLELKIVLERLDILRRKTYGIYDLQSMISDRQEYSQLLGEKRALEIALNMAKNKASKTA